jgi:hypothetical protein
VVCACVGVLSLTQVAGAVSFAKQRSCPSASCLSISFFFLRVLVFLMLWLWLLVGVALYNFTIFFTLFSFFFFYCSLLCPARCRSRCIVSTNNTLFFVCEKGEFSMMVVTDCSYRP